MRIRTAFDILIVLSCVSVGMYVNIKRNEVMDKSRSEAKDSTAVAVKEASGLRLALLMKERGLDSLANVVKKRDEKILSLATMVGKVRPVLIERIKTDTAKITMPDSNKYVLESGFDERSKWLHFKGNIITSFSLVNGPSASTQLTDVSFEEDPFKLNLLITRTRLGDSVARLDYDHDRFSDIQFNVTERRETAMNLRGGVFIKATQLPTKVVSIIPLLQFNRNDLSIVYGFNGSNHIIGFKKGFKNRYFIDLTTINIVDDARMQFMLRIF